MFRSPRRNADEFYSFQKRLMHSPSFGAFCTVLNKIGLNGSCCPSETTLALNLQLRILASTQQVKYPWHESIYTRLYRDHPPFSRPGFRHSSKYSASKFNKLFVRSYLAFMRSFHAKATLPPLRPPPAHSLRQHRPSKITGPLFQPVFLHVQF